MTQVVSHQEKIEAAGANVLTVSFGTQYWAQVWLQETASPFPFLLDPDRTAYRAYGLTASFWSSWSVANLWYYAKALLQGRETFGKRGDTHQLGGDFIVDAQGVVRLAHPSSDPTDRPSLATIMSVLRQID